MAKKNPKNPKMTKKFYNLRQVPSASFDPLVHELGIKT